MSLFEIPIINLTDLGDTPSLSDQAMTTFESPYTQVVCLVLNIDGINVERFYKVKFKPEKDQLKLIKCYCVGIQHCKEAAYSKEKLEKFKVTLTHSLEVAKKSKSQCLKGSVDQCTFEAVQIYEVEKRFRAKRVYNESFQLEVSHVHSVIDYSFSKGNIKRLLSESHLLDAHNYIDGVAVVSKYDTSLAKSMETSKQSLSQLEESVTLLTEKDKGKELLYKDSIQLINATEFQKTEAPEAVPPKIIKKESYTASKVPPSESVEKKSTIPKSRSTPIKNYCYKVTRAITVAIDKEQLSEVLKNYKIILKKKIENAKSEDTSLAEVKAAIEDLDNALKIIKDYLEKGIKPTEE